MTAGTRVETADRGGASAPPPYHSNVTNFTNCTDFRDDHVLAFIERVMESETAEDPGLPLRVEFVIDFPPSNWPTDPKLWPRFAITWGEAKDTIQLLLPRPGAEMDPVEFAHTISHECRHARGLTDEGLGDPRYDHKVPGWRELYAWAEDYPLERNAPAAK